MKKLSLALLVSCLMVNAVALASDAQSADSSALQDRLYRAGTDSSKKLEECMEVEEENTQKPSSSQPKKSASTLERLAGSVFAVECASRPYVLEYGLPAVGAVVAVKFLTPEQLAGRAVKTAAAGAGAYVVLHLMQNLFSAPSHVASQNSSTTDNQEIVRAQARDQLKPSEFAVLMALGAVGTAIKPQIGAAALGAGAGYAVKDIKKIVTTAWNARHSSRL